MCFCAGASFTAAGLLSVIGLVSLNKARSLNQKPLALVPLFFAIQQAAEGIVWVTSGKTLQATWHTIGVYVFLFFATVVWPAWIPLSIELIETQKKRKAVLGYLTLYGTIISLALLVALIIFGAQARIENHHVRYISNMPYLLNSYSILVYCVATIAPFFVSSLKSLWFLGILIGLSCVATYIVWQAFFTSIWCFFAALISIGVIVVLDEINRRAIKK